MSILFTIISICYNDKFELEKTIKSIIKQEKIKNEIEYIIMDGGSNDGTLDMIENYKKQLISKAVLRIYSESDKGIYDAMNKSVVRAAGRWVIFMNAGDTFHSSSVMSEIESIIAKSDYNADVICGKVLKYNKWIQQEIVPPSIEYLKNDMIFCHQAIFFKREVHLKYLYDLSYKLVADYNTVLKMYLDGKKFDYVDILIVDYNMDGASSANILDTYKEIRKVRANNGIIKGGFLEFLLYRYGVLKRVILMKLPQKIRWKLVSIKRKILKGEAKF